MSQPFIRLTIVEAVLEEIGPVKTTEFWCAMIDRGHITHNITVNRFRSDLCCYWRAASISFAGGKWWTVSQWMDHVRDRLHHDRIYT